MMYYYLIYNSENVVTAFFTNDTPCNFGTEVTREEYDAILTAAGISHVMPDEPEPPKSLEERVSDLENNQSGGSADAVYDELAAAYEEGVNEA